MKTNSPTFHLFGHVQFLSLEEAAAATRDQRIASVWPYVKRRALKFVHSLSFRDQANLDFDDVCHSIYEAVAKRDHKWTPERGKYVNFAASIIENHLNGIRDTAKTVHSPRNTSCRMKEYEQSEAQGTLTDKCRKTRADIQRTHSGCGNISDLHFADHTCGPPDEGMVERERMQVYKNALDRAIAQLTPLESLILGKVNGLGGQEMTNESGIAWEMMMEVEKVRAIRKRAETKIRKLLVAENDPILGELFDEDA